MRIQELSLSRNAVKTRAYRARLKESQGIPDPVSLAAPVLKGDLPCTRDPDLWFSDTPEGRGRAVAGCRTCPDWKPCRKWGLEHPEVKGVWGGLPEAQRRRIARRRAA